MNNEQVRQPVDYKVTTDVMAIVDVSEAFNLAKMLEQTNKAQVTAIRSAIEGFDDAFRQLDNLNRHVTGDICGGGASGVPSPVRGNLSAETTAVTQRLRGISSNLTRVAP
jgi:hypothetical protein